MVIAQIVRVAAAIFCIIADHSNNRKKMLIFNAIYNFLNGVHYALLNAITGAISSIITVLRNVIFYVFKKRVPVAVLLVYFIIVILINLGSINSPISMIPVFLVMQSLGYQNRRHHHVLARNYLQHLCRCLRWYCSMRD